jgi:hypothetical protein
MTLLSAVNGSVPPWVSQLLLSLVGTAVGGVIGSFTGYKLAIRSHRAQKRHEFIVEQLRDFYTPMIALRSEIKFNTDECIDIMNNYLSPDCFFKVVWPLYRKLATHFTTHLWLASPDTRRQHADVLRVVNGYSVQFDNNLIDQDDLISESTALDDRLHSFYEHLDAKLDELQRRLMPNE